jgi:hypothetical protein
MRQVKELKMESNNHNHYSPHGVDLELEVERQRKEIQNGNLFINGDEIKGVKIEVFNSGKLKKEADKIEAKEKIIEKQKKAIVEAREFAKVIIPWVFKDELVKQAKEWLEENGDE